MQKFVLLRHKKRIATPKEKDSSARDSATFWTVIPQHLLIQAALYSALKPRRGIDKGITAKSRP